MSREEIEHVLSDFRQWLSQVAAPEEGDNLPPGDAPDLHSFLSSLIALKQEIHLGTRAVRAQTEQNETTIEHLATALEALQSEQLKARNAIEKPLLEALMNLWDVSSLASKQAQRVSEQVLPLLNRLTEEQTSPGLPLPPLPSYERSWWDKLTGKSQICFVGWQEETQAQLDDWLRDHRHQWNEGLNQIRHLLSAMITGYEMGLRRIERALREQGLEVISCLGESFDPERMEVLEVVHDTECGDNEVVQVVRRGYHRDGIVYRIAQVKVAKHL